MISLLNSYNQQKTIVDKPWGSETIFAHTDKYVGKILRIKAGQRLSLQSHVVKDETIMVQQGRLSLVLESGEMVTIELSPGETYHIVPGTVHRFCATAEDVCLIEVSTPELDDVVRYEDDYGRIQ